MSCTASINPPPPCQLYLQAPCLSQPTSAYVFTVSPLLSLPALPLSPKHLTRSAVLLMDSTVTRSILVSAKGNLNVFICPSCSSAPCLFLQAPRSLNHATPPSTTTALYTVVFIPADALYCILHLTLSSIGSTRLLQRFLHSPSLLLKKKKKKGAAV